MELAIGGVAPDFSLPDQDGQQVTLSSFRGKKIILYFYPADDTPGCTTQACGLRDRFEEIQEKNAIVLGISPDGAKSHAKFRSKYNIPFTLLSDPDHRVAEKYGAWGDKTSFGKRYKGIIRSHFVIDETGRIVDLKIKVNAKQSPDFAVHALTG